MLRTKLAGVLCMCLLSNLAAAADGDGEKVLDRFVGVWQNDITLKGPESPEERKLKSNEVVAKELKGQFLIGREMNPQSDVKVMSFTKYDPREKKYVLTYFNTAGLLGTEWKGTWDAATSTLTSKASAPPPTWTSESVSRFVGQDKVEAHAFMKDDKGKLIFESTYTKTRLRELPREKILADWKEPADPKAELLPELKVLDRLAGTWDVIGVHRKAEWTPEETTVKSKVVRTWVLNRTYLQDHSTSDDGNESIALLTYDAKRKEYRSWWFSSQGYTSKSTGQKIAGSDSISWKSTLPDGQTSVGSVTIADDDHHEWKILITDAAGKVYFDTTWTCVRAKP